MQIGFGQLACNVRVMDEILDVLDDDELQQLGNDANTALAEVYSVFVYAQISTVVIIVVRIRNLTYKNLYKT